MRGDGYRRSLRAAVPIFRPVVRYPPTRYSDAAMLSVDESYAWAERLTRAQRTTFYHTFRFLTPPRRRAIYAVYAYSRRLDDAVDAVEEKAVAPQSARAELAVLRGFLDGVPEDDPLVPALRHSIESFGIPRRHFEELIAGMEMDLEVKRYATFDELYRYCYRAAAAVGLVCIEIFGHDGPPASADRDPATNGARAIEAPAEALGIAMQLTNILRDLAEDIVRDRIYIPLEDLERFAYGEDDLRRRVVDDRFRRLMEFEVARARHYFELSEPLFAHITPESRHCPELLRRFYSQILERIERQRYDVFAHRPRLAPHRKLALVARTWWESRRAGR